MFLIPTHYHSLIDPIFSLASALTFTYLKNNYQNFLAIFCLHKLTKYKMLLDNRINFRKNIKNILTYGGVCECQWVQFLFSCAECSNNELHC